MNNAKSTMSNNEDVFWIECWLSLTYWRQQLWECVQQKMILQDTIPQCDYPSLSIMIEITIESCIMWRINPQKSKKSS